MSLEGKQVIQIFVVLVLISLGVAHEDGMNKGKIGQCLGVCGDDIVSCMIDCYVRDFQHFLTCAMKCEDNNNKCMGNCTNITIPPVSSRPAPPA